MDFSLTPEQIMLRDSVRAFLADHYSSAARTAAVRSDAGWRRELWTAFARDLGILGIGVPEAHGGVGGGAVEHMIVAEAFGGSLVIEPYLETVVIAAAALAAGGGERASALLPEIAAGRATLALAWAEPTTRADVRRVETMAIADGNGWRLDGGKSAAAAAPWADQLLIVARSSGAPGEIAGLSLFLVDRETAGVTFHSYPTIDDRRAADVLFDGVRLPADALIGEEGQGYALVQSLFDRAIAALAAESVGLMRRMLSDTRAYLSQRRQFRQPLAEFQVLQHRMVDMLMQIELAEAATYRATLMLDTPTTQRACAASSAKVTIDKALRFVGRNAIQLHGGMGMTDELAVGHAFRRGTMIEAEFGGTDHHLARYAALSAKGAAA